MIMMAHCTYLGYGGCENYNFIKLANSLHELVDTWSLNDVHIVEIAFDLDRYCEISLMQYLRRLAY